MTSGRVCVWTCGENYSVPRSSLRAEATPHQDSRPKDKDRIPGGEAKGASVPLGAPDAHDGVRVVGPLLRLFPVIGVGVGVGGGEDPAPARGQGRVGGALAGGDVAEGEGERDEVAEGRGGLEGEALRPSVPLSSVGCVRAVT